MTEPQSRPRDASAPEFDPAAYDYPLPEDRIALHPARPRDAARLLVLRRDRGGVEHKSVRDLPDLLNPGDRLVVNETRVIPARLRGRLERGGKEIELLLIRETRPREWTAWIRGARSLRPGDGIRFGDREAVARVGPREGESVRLDFEGDVAALLANAGHMPLPPYIRRADGPEDREDYQTVFARVPGAVAAPTAGLHFTPELIERLDARGVAVSRVLLHVGPGTFRPVRAADLRDHRVESEYFRIEPATAEAIAGTRARGGHVVAVGTTTTRCLEAAAGPEGAREGWTDLTILPPYRFRAIDGLMTNFHLPRSSLLLLVSAFAGRERILSAYAEAVREGYRFYSYGDAMLIL
jgi:S-adenosylmethionine:tRNA ribosyltransferase-isomerase